MVSLAGPELDTESAADLPAPPRPTTLAWRDLRAGFGKRWMWTALALQDIKLRYRGSLLGPFWVTISTLIMVVAMGVIYSRLFHVDTGEYLPYLSLGLIIWQFLSGTITEGCETFLREQSIIQQVPLPFSIHAYRAVCRNLIVLGHNAIIVPFILLIFKIVPNWIDLLMLVPALLLLALNGLWISMLLGMVSTRFRDIPPIVGSFLQVLFFVTPVIWPIDTLGDLRWIATANPLFAALDVVRAPLLGVAPAASSWSLLVGWTMAGCVIAFVAFARFRARIAYWI